MKNKSTVILIMGLMTALSPFSIDMYLPAFESMAKEFNTTVAQVSLTLSSYFIGISFGQLFYGPLLDRYGRKPPLYIGLLIYVLASILCAMAPTTEFLIGARFVQAIGGCAAGVAAMAMVRDLFTTTESAKVFSLLILILGTSPLLAPTAGGYLATGLGWRAVFICLALMSSLLLIFVWRKLPESHQANKNVSLKVWPILTEYSKIIAHPGFYTYAVSGAVAFAGLFVYLAGSPIIFLQTFKVSAQTYSWIFAIVAAGLIGSSQFNSFLLKKFSNRELLVYGVNFQILIAVVFLGLTYFGYIHVSGTVFMLFMYLGCFGITNPNSGALALEPFGKNAGSAAALMGFLQMGIGAVFSMLIGLFNISTMLPVILIMVSASVLSRLILLLGTKQIAQEKQL